MKRKNYIDEYRDTPDQIAVCLSCDIPADKCGGTCRGGRQKNYVQNKFNECFAYELWLNGKTDQEIADEMHVCADTVYRWRKMNCFCINRVKQWDESLAVEMFHAGNTDKEIASAVGRSESIIKKWRLKKRLLRV